MKIINQPRGTLTESDRLELARLLVKAGYTVRLGKCKQNEGAKPKSVLCVEYFEASEVRDE